MSLNSLFPGYLGYSEEDLSSLLDDAVIFIDANVLLNLFEYSLSTYDEFFKLFTSAEFRNRFYITYQVGLEYSRNKIKRTERQTSASEKISKKLEDQSADMKKWMRENFRFHSTIDVDGILKDFENFVNGVKLSKLTTSAASILDHQKNVENFISGAIGDKITPKPTDDAIKEIIRIGKDRYSKKLPPGFEDEKSKSEDLRIYGDLIGWLEMIKFAKQEGETKILFITDDNKEDWWRRENGKTIGPHSLLVQEMLDNGIKYYQYSSEQFLKHASMKLGTTVSVEVLKEVKEVAKTENRDRKIRWSFSNSSMTCSLAIKSLIESKNIGEIGKSEYVAGVITEVDNLMGSYIHTGRKIDHPEVQKIISFREQVPPKYIDDYLKDTGLPVYDFVDRIVKIINELAEKERKETLNNIKRRIVFSTKTE